MASISCLVKSPKNDNMLKTLLGKKEISDIDYVRYNAVESLVDKTAFSVANNVDFDEGLYDFENLAPDVRQAYIDTFRDWSKAIDNSKEYDDLFNSIIKVDNEKFSVEYGTYNRTEYYTGKNPEEVKAKLKVQLAKDAIDNKVKFIRPYERQLSLMAKRPLDFTIVKLNNKQYVVNKNFQIVDAATQKTLKKSDKDYKSIKETAQRQFIREITGNSLLSNNTTPNAYITSQLVARMWQTMGSNMHLLNGQEAMRAKIQEINDNNIAFQTGRKKKNKLNNSNSQVISVNLTQNAGGRLESFPQNSKDYERLNNAYNTLNNPSASTKAKKDAEKTINDIESKRTEQLEKIVNDILYDVDGVELEKIDKGTGLYMGDAEYTSLIRFRIAKGKENTAKALMALISQATRQDAFIENFDEEFAEIGKKNKTLSNENYSPTVKIRTKNRITPELKSKIKSEFDKAGIDAATITDFYISASYFNPDYSPATIQQAKEFYNKVNNVIQQAYDISTLHGVQYDKRTRLGRTSQTGESERTSRKSSSSNSQTSQKEELPYEIINGYNYSFYNEATQNENERDYSALYNENEIIEGTDVTPKQVLGKINNMLSLTEHQIHYMRMPNGTIYGFAYNGELYFDNTLLNPNTLIHEYSHLWCQAVQAGNPELWGNIRELLKNDKLAKSIKDTLKMDENYANLSEDEMLEEIIAQFSGQQGRERLEQLQKKMRDNKTLFQKFVDFLKQIWDWIGKNLFQIDHFNSFEEITDRILYDLVIGTDLQITKNLNEYNKQANKLNSSIRYQIESQDKNGEFLKSEIPGVELTYNKEQSQAIKDCLNWLKDKNADTKQWYTIIGKAGTGKTTIIKEVLYRYQKQAGYLQSVCACALSHKAKNVLYSSLMPIDVNVNHKGGVYLTMKTLAGALAMKESGGGKFEVDKYAKSIPVAEADIVIVDECSMVDADKLRLILQKKNKNAKVIFLGDDGQLPPIVENKLAQSDSPVFYKDDNPLSKTHQSRLVVRVRQSESNNSEENSPILPYADNFWNESHTTQPTNKPFALSVENQIKKKGAILTIKQLTKSVTDNIAEAYKKSIDTGDFNHIIYLTYTNASADYFNSLIHDRFFKDKEYQQTGYSIGDHVRMQDNFQLNESLTIHNADEGIIRNIENSRIEIQTIGEKDYKIPLCDVTVEFKIPGSNKTQTYTFPVVWNSQRKVISGYLNEIAEYVKSHPVQHPVFGLTKDWKPWSKLKYKTFADMTYAYASTIHKSQGSTYDIAICNLSDIDNVSKINSKEKSQAAYTALTRAKKVAVVISGQAQSTTENGIEYTAQNIESNTKTAEEINNGKFVDNKGEAHNVAPTAVFKNDNTPIAQQQTNTSLFGGPDFFNTMSEDEKIALSQEDAQGITGEMTNTFEVGLPQNNQAQQQTNNNNQQLLNSLAMDFGNGEKVQEEGNVQQQTPIQTQTQQPQNPGNQFQPSMTPASTPSPAIPANANTPERKELDNIAGQIPTQNGYEANAKQIAKNNPELQQWKVMNSQFLKDSVNDAILTFQNIEKTTLKQIDNILRERSAKKTGGVYDKLDAEGKYYQFRYETQRRNKDLFRRIEQERNRKNPNQKKIQELYSKILPTSFEEYVQKIGPENLIEQIKKDRNLEAYRRKKNNPTLTEEDMLREYPKFRMFYDNFDIILRNALHEINFYFGYNIFNGLEELSTTTDDADMNTGLEEDSNVELDESPTDEMYNRSGDNTKSTEQTLSKDIKRYFYSVKMRNKKGELIRDNTFRQVICVNPSTVHNILNEKLGHNMTRPSQMIPLLESMQENYPWVKDIITDISKNEMLFNKFYSQYRKHHQTMAILRTQTKQGPMLKLINKSQAEQKLELETSVNVKAGFILANASKSAYDKNGNCTGKYLRESVKIYDKRLLGEREQITKNKGYGDNELITIMQRPQNGRYKNNTSLREAVNDPDWIKYELQPKGYNSFQDYIVTRLHQIGVNVPEDFDAVSVIEHASKDIKFETQKETLRNLEQAINGVFIVTSEKGATGTPLWDRARGYYRDVFKIIENCVRDTSESSAKIGKKQRYSWVNPNYINSIIDKIKALKSDEEVKRWVEREFGSVDFFRNQDSGEWRFEWAKWLFDPYASSLWEDLDYMRLAAVDDEEYENWNQELCSKALFLTYQQGKKERSFNKHTNTAWYRMGLYSDSPAGDFIKGPRFTDGDGVTYDQILLHKFYGVFNQERSRMRTVKERAEMRLNNQSGRSNPIAGYDAVFEKDKNGHDVLEKAGGLVLRYLPQLNYLRIDNDFINYFINNIDKVSTVELDNGIGRITKTISSSYDAFKESALSAIEGMTFVEAMDYLDSHKDELTLTDDDIETFFAVGFQKTFDEDFQGIYDYWNESGNIAVVDTKGRTDQNKEKIYSVMRDINFNRLQVPKEVKDELNDNVSKLNNDKVVRETIELLNKYLPADRQIQYQYPANYKVLREYCMNAQFARSQTFMLTTTDLAFYGKVETQEGTKEDHDIAYTHYDKNGNEKWTKYYKIKSDSTIKDLQKRFKEVHAPSIKYNHENGTYAQQYHKTVVISDAELMSRAIEEIKFVINKAVSDKLITAGEAENIIKAFSKITTTDGQAYRTISSYERLLGQMGLLTNEVKYALKNIKEGRLSKADFNIVFQTLKPYVYTRQKIDSKVTTPNGNPILISNPIQHKNSEFALMVMFSAIAHSSRNILDKNSVLAGINQFMEDNNIDVLQFNSAQKVGNQAVVDTESLGSSKDAVIRALTNITGITKDNPNGNPEVVKMLDPDDWGIQMQTMEQHIIDKVQAIGSQVKTVLILDVPENHQFKIPGRKETMTKEEVLNHYNNLLAADIIEAFVEINEKFKDPKQIEALLQEAVATSFKYDQKLINALTWDEANQSFRIPLHDRQITSQVQQIINSIFRSRISKQKTRGGTCIQVSDFGIKDELNIRFKDNKGNLLLTKKDFIKEIRKKHKDISDEEADKRFKEYVDNNMHSIAYIECFMPCYSAELYDALCDENGFIDIDRLPEELRKVIAYRSPTEDTYSCLPLKIVGFTPPYNGSVIMLPSEIITMTGSDFDVDKLFLMLKEFTIEKYDMEKARADWEDSEDQSKGVPFDQWMNWNCDAVDKNGKPKYELPQSKWHIKEVRYNYNKKEHQNSKSARHNSYIDTSFELLTTPAATQKMLNPGGFDQAKHEAKLNYLIDTLTQEELLEITKAENTFEAIKILKEKSTKELENLENYANRKQNPLSDYTATRLHQQNMQGLNQISVYAVAKAFSPLIQHADMNFVFESPNGEIPFVLNGNKSVKFTDETNLNGIIVKKIHLGNSLNERGHLISKHIANFVAMSVDNGKDPNLALLNSTMDSAKIYTTLSLLGYEIDEIAALMTQPVIRELYKESAFSLASHAENIWEDFKKKHNKGKEVSIYNSDIQRFGEMNTEQLHYAKFLFSKFKSDPNSLSDAEKHFMFVVQKMSLDLIVKIDDLAKQLQYAIQTARGDSSKGSAGQFMINNVNLERKVAALHDNDVTPNLEINKGILNGDIDTNLGDMSFEQLTKRYYDNPIGFKAAMTELGVLGIKDVIGQHFLEYNPNIRFLLDHLAYKSLDINQQRAFKMLNAIQLFVSTSCESFGRDKQINSTTGKRAWYLGKFPQQFEEWLNNQPKEYKANNVFLNNLIIKEKDNKDPFKSILLQDLGVSKNITDEITSGLEDLYYDNPDIATKLFVYSIFRGGFGFNPQTFGRYVPITVMLNTPGYMEVIRRTADLLNENSRYVFIEQFARNNYKDNTICPTISKFASYKKTDDGKLNVNSRTYYEETADREGLLYRDRLLPVVVKEITAKGTQLYRRDDTSIELIKPKEKAPYLACSYYPVDKLGLNTMYPEYSYDEEPQSLIINRYDDTESENNQEISGAEQLADDNDVADKAKVESSENKKEEMPTTNNTKTRTKEDMC